MKRVTQKQAVFYRLLKNRNEEGNVFIPVHQFMGEIFVPEFDKWGYVSYECSARLSEMFRDNPGLLAREYITGKSGAKYYGYRIHREATAEKIVDPDLRKVYEAVKRATKPI